MGLFPIGGGDGIGGGADGGEDYGSNPSGTESESPLMNRVYGGSLRSGTPSVSQHREVINRLVCASPE